ncbi:MAG: glycoside hydrolase family 127 protein, partial [Ferruginibacter sp.]
AMQIKNSFQHKDMEATRSGWFECSCCPTNLARLIPSIPGYMYAQKEDNLYINLFINSNVDLSIRNKQLQIIQQNNYPWDGALVFIINPKTAAAFNLLVRIPGWAQNKAIPSGLYRFQNNSASKPIIKVNGQAFEYTIVNGYATINRTWKRNDKVEVTLPMEVRRVVASEKIKDDIGKIALQRGPLMYCAEWPDNNGKTSNIIIPANAAFTTEFKPGLLNGVTILKTEVPAFVINSNESISTVQQSFTAIPYYSWANRGKGEMMVWFPEAVKDIDVMAK